MSKPRIVCAPGECEKPEHEHAIECPSCKQTGFIDEDQYRGKVSVICPRPGCGYHETHDLSGTASGL